MAVGESPHKKEGKEGCSVLPPVSSSLVASIHYVHADLGGKKWGIISKYHLSLKIMCLKTERMCVGGGGIFGLPKYGLPFHYLSDH